MRRLLRREEIAELSRFLDVESLPEQFVLFESGKRVRCATRKAFELAQNLKAVTSIGVYSAKRMGREHYFSIEGSQLFGPFLKKGVLEVSVSEAENWLKGLPLERTVTDAGVVVVRAGWLFLGSGRVSRDGKIYPLISRERMITLGEP